MLLYDSAVAVSRERTPEGFLRLRARIARSGLHDYKAGEIGGPPGAAPDTTVRVYRPIGAVFDPASMASFAGKPVTLDHPPAMVDSANWKHFAVGHSGASVTRDGDHLSTDLVITDATAVARAEAGAELSNGYWADFVFKPGRTPAGEPYDAVQQNIRGNHIALVDAGRCGPTCRLDAPAGAAATDPCGCQPDPTKDPPRASKSTVTVDGVAIETTPEGAAALERLLAALDQARAAHQRDVEVRDGELAALRASAPDAAALDAMLAERALVIEGARRLLGTSFDARGQGTAAIRRAVVERLLGPERVRDRGEAYVEAAFDALAATRTAGNALASHLAAGLADGASSREAALATRNRYLTQAWKGDPVQDQTSGA